MIALAVAVFIALVLVLVPGKAAAQTLYACQCGSTSGIISSFDTSSNLQSAPDFTAAPNISGIAITPDGKRGYMSDNGQSELIVFDTATRKILAQPDVGETCAVAITPDGSEAYVNDCRNNRILVLSTATNSVIATIPVGGFPSYAAAFTPDGKLAFISSGNTVSVVNVATNSITGTPISVPSPMSMAVTPDGKTLYVLSSVNPFATPPATITAIDIATRSVVAEIPVPDASTSSNLVISPDGSSGYITDASDNTVIPFSTVSDTTRTPIALSGTPGYSTPGYMAYTADGKTLYVSRHDTTGGSSISVINTATQKVTQDIPFSFPGVLAVSPVQAPTAAFSAAPTTVGASGQAYSFDAGTSYADEDSIANYSWNFGDGSSGSGVNVSHVYTTPGNYTVTLTVTDSNGCSTQTVFTGQEAYCNGGPGATISKTVQVAAPPVSAPGPHPGDTGGSSPSSRISTRVKLGCPASALSPCMIRAVIVPSRKKKARPESRPSHSRIKPGDHKLATLVPAAPYEHKLAQAETALVKLTSSYKKRVGHGQVRRVKQTRIVKMRLHHSKR